MEETVEKLSFKYRTCLKQLVALMNGYLKEELVTDEKYRDIPKHLEEKMQELVKNSDDTLHYLVLLDEKKELDMMQGIWEHRLQYCYKQLLIGIAMDKLPFPKNVTDIFYLYTMVGLLSSEKKTE